VNTILSDYGPPPWGTIQTYSPLTQADLTVGKTSIAWRARTVKTNDRGNDNECWMQLRLWSAEQRVRLALALGRVTGFPALRLEAGRDERLEALERENEALRARVGQLEAFRETVLLGVRLLGD
jgi:hypothetical protein